VHGYYATGLDVAQGIDGDRTIHCVRQEQSPCSPDQHPAARKLVHIEHEAGSALRLDR
jgi:hypothetical protein